MDQRALADCANVDQTYLSKLENGLREPTEDIVSRIAEALGFPLSFFYQSDMIYGFPASVHAMHRKKKSVPKKALGRIHAELNIKLRHIRRLVESVQFSEQFPLPQYDVDEYHGDIESIAQSVRQAWLIPHGPIRNLTECVERAGIIVLSHSFAGTAIDGISFAIPGMPPCIFLNPTQPPDRMRFTLAHELGHIILHKVPCAEMDNQADTFAGAFLMPKEDILPSLRGRITLIRLTRLKLVWRVAMQAILYRAGELKLLSSYQSRDLWQQMAPFKLREPPELDFEREQPTVWPKLLRIHLQELGYTVAELAESLCIWEQEFRTMYQLVDQNTRSHLKVLS